MQLTLNVFGKSSKKKSSIQLNSNQQDKTLLEVLHENEIPIASSCRGEQVCKKCIINGDLLACSISVKDYLKRKGDKIEVDYL